MTQNIIEDMKDELESIQAFISDAERLAAVEESDKHDRIQKWVKKLIEAAFLLEDIIDEYLISEEGQQPREVAQFIQTKALRYKLEDFRSRFRELKNEGFEGDYGYQTPPSCSEQEPGPSENQNARLQYPQQDVPLSGMDEADIVGFEAPSAELIDWLVKGTQERTAISVVGMGGLGKTTLARKVFNSKEVKEHFDYRGWLTVPQSYTIEVLLRIMLREFYKQTRDDYPPPQVTFERNRQWLIEELRKCLQQKRYVVFFDDVWDTRFWDEIKFVLLENMKGSRVFITTRNMNVAMHCESYFNVKVHLLQHLTLKESLELLYKKALRSDFKKSIPEPLRDVSSEIVEKCNGVPLAIVAVGGVLSVKAKTASEWKRFSRNLSSELDKNPHLYSLKNMFSLSYNELPSSLKPCLLYFAIYPENYEVKSKRLIRQWIAEGFVKEESGKTLEQVAEGYLIELINRSLVQVSSVSIDGKVKGCRVHDLIREMILRKAEDLRFCRFVSEDDPSVLSGTIRRISIATTCNDSMETGESSHVRSLLFFTEEKLPENLVRRIPTTHKLLKILDSESSRLYDVPEKLGVLIHLKYLSFRKTEMRRLPKSIGRLQNLETLDLRQTAINEIPEEVSKLRKLRHLLGDKLSLIHLKGGIGGMSFLQTLSEVGIDEDGKELIKELGKLTQLRKLSLFDVREELGNDLCSSISQMPHLEKLYIETKSKNAAIDLSFGSHPAPAMLRKLRLQAKLNKLPDWIPKLENLVELSLSYSQLRADPLESLKNLPNLLVFNLAVQSYEGECLHFKKEGFQKLKELGLRYLYGLNSVIIDGGALPCLKELTLMNIPNLKMAPSGIKQLEKLQVTNFHFMPTEFERSIEDVMKK